MNFVKMENLERIINNLRLAIELAGDGGPQPFTEDEYNEMHEFLNSFNNHE